VQPPEEPTDDVSVRLDWPVQDEGLEPVERADRRGRLSGRSSRPIASAAPHGGSSDLLPARIDTGRRGRSGDKPSADLGADEGARGKSDAALERLASGVDRLATMVQRLDDSLAAQVERLPTEVVRRLDALLGEASDLRRVQERLVALTQTRAKQESELLTSINRLAEDLKAVRKQIPVSKRAGGQVEAGTVERIADAVRRAMEQPAPKRAVAKRDATTAKVTPGRRPARAKSTAKSSDAATATRRPKRAS
jgi:hypothetical protein